MLRRIRLPPLILATLLLGGVAAFGATGIAAKAFLFLGILAFGIGVSARALSGSQPVLIPPMAWPLAGMFVFGSVQAASGWSHYPWATGERLVDLAVWVVLAIVARTVLAGRSDREAFLDVVLAGGGMVALVALLRRAVLPEDEAFGPFVNPNHYAVFAELVLPLAIVAAAGGRRVWGLTLTAVLYGSVVASGSRAGALVATAEVVLIPMLIRPRWRGRGEALRTAALVGAVAVLGAAVAGWQLLWERVGTTDLLAGRREILLSALALATAHPWTGTGLGTFEVMYPAAALYDPGLRIDHAHNDWLEVAVEGGIPLASLCLTVIAVTLRSAKRAPWSWGGYAAVLHGLADFPLYIPALAAMIVTFLAISSAAGETNPARH